MTELDNLIEKMTRAGTSTKTDLLNSVIDGIVNPKPYVSVYISDYSLNEHRTIVCPKWGKYKGQSPEGVLPL